MSFFRSERDVQGSSKKRDSLLEEKCANILKENNDIQQTEQAMDP